MKNKIITAALAAVMVLSMGATAFAHGCYGCYGYADTNGDGICDVCGRTHCAGFVDVDGDGYCDNGDIHYCGGFVDANGDGYCDYRGTYSHCSGYADNNGDGYCDICGYENNVHHSSVCTTTYRSHHSRRGHHGCH